MTTGIVCKAIDRFFLYLARVLMAVACLFMVVMAVHVTADITARLVLHRSLNATNAIVSHYYMVGLIFLPLLAARRERALIVVELLAGLFGPRLNRLLDALSDLLMAGWFLLFTVITAHMALDKTASGEFVETTVSVLRVWPTRWLLPVGTGATGLYCLVQGVQALVAAPGTDKTGAS